MAETNVQLMVEGEDAEAAAKALSESVFEIFGHRAAPVPMEAAGSEPGKKIAPWLEAGLKVGGFLLAVPGSLMALYNLSDRVKKKPLVKKFLKDAETFLATHPKAEISIRLADGRLLRVRGTDADTVMDAVTKVAR